MAYGTSIGQMWYFIRLIFKQIKQCSKYALVEEAIVQALKIQLIIGSKLAPFNFFCISVRIPWGEQDYQICH